jgi:hypothetical protein
MQGMTARRMACEAELALSRRTTPDLYLASTTTAARSELTTNLRRRGGIF